MVVETTAPVARVLVVGRTKVFAVLALFEVRDSFAIVDQKVQVPLVVSAVQVVVDTTATVVRVLAVGRTKISAALAVFEVRDSFATVDKKDADSIGSRCLYRLLLIPLRLVYGCWLLTEWQHLY